MATKVVTGKVRFSYVNIFKSRSFQQGQDAKFSICLLIPKEDKATIKKINAAIQEAIEEGIGSKWGGKKPANSLSEMVMMRELTKQKNMRECISLTQTAHRSLASLTEI